MLFNKTIKFKKLTSRIFCYLFLLISLSGCNLENTHGVLVGDEITPSIKNHIRKNISQNLIEEGLIAYYDTTVFLDNSESYILTNESLVIYCDGIKDWEVGVLDCLGTQPHGTNIIPLKNITNIYESDEWYDGTSCSVMVELCFYVSVYTDEEFFFSTAWFNNGDLFYNELMKAWESEVF